MKSADGNHSISYKRVGKQWFDPSKKDQTGCVRIEEDDSG